MTYKIYFALLVAVWVAAVAMALLAVGPVFVAVAGTAGIVLFCLLWRSICKPLNSIGNGISLLREQDFSSRLRLTGQTDADKVVRLFNSLMDSMKNERLKQMEQSHLLGLLIEASPSGIAICDLDNRIVERNPAFRRLVDSEMEQKLAAMTDDEVQTIRPDGIQVFRCSRLWFMDSGFRRRFYLVEPMTEEIARAEKQLFTKIIRTIGHEVNNTMGSVTCVLETLKMLHSDDEDAETTIQSTIESCMNLAEFVRSYSSLVKLPAPVPEATDLNSFIEGIAPSLRADLPENINLTVAYSAAPCPVMADEMLMHRVVSNIVRNAAESIGSAKGEIHIGIAPSRLEITDNGPGISPEVAQQIFTPFFSTKRPDRGLGLMLVADILRAHKTRFSLATDPETKLTAFRIIFPRN